MIAASLCSYCVGAIFARKTAELLLHCVIFDSRSLFLISLSYDTLFNWFDHI